MFSLRRFPSLHLGSVYGTSGDCGRHNRRGGCC